MLQSANNVTLARGPVGIGLVFTPRLDRSSRRLARFRRILGACMIVTGTPVVALYRAESPTIRHALALLAIAWLSMVLPMIRLVCLEWQHNRALEAARSGHGHR
jgi:hypothetical protein